MSSLYELCAHTIVNHTNMYGISRLPLPPPTIENLKSYALTKNTPEFVRMRRKNCRADKGGGFLALQSFRKTCRGGSGGGFGGSRTLNTPADAANVRCGPSSRKSCTIS